MTNEQPTALLEKLTDLEAGWVRECRICTIDDTDRYVALCGGHAARLEQDNHDAIVVPEPPEPPEDGEDGQAPLDVEMGLHYARLALEAKVQSDQATQFTHTAAALVFAAQALQNLEQMGIKLTEWAAQQPDRAVPRQQMDVPVPVAGFNEAGQLVLFVPKPGDPAQNGAS